MYSNSGLDAERDKINQGAGGARARQEGLMRIGSQTRKEGGGHSELVEALPSSKDNSSEGQRSATAHTEGDVYANPGVNAASTVSQFTDDQKSERRKSPEGKGLNNSSVQGEGGKGEATWLHRKDKEVDSVEGKGTYEYGKGRKAEGLPNFSVSQVGGGKGVAFEDHGKDEKVGYDGEKGTYEYVKGREDKGLRNFSSCQVEGGKRGAMESHEKDENGSFDMGKGTYEYKKGREDEARQGEYGSEPSKVEHDTTRHRSAPWATGTTDNEETANVEGETSNRWEFEAAR